MINAPIDINRMLEDHIYIRDLVKMNYDIKQNLMIVARAEYCKVEECRVKGHRYKYRDHMCSADEARTRVAGMPAVDRRSLL